MIYARIILVLLILLIVVYYAMIVAHLSGVINLTDRKVEFSKLCIPFYYWVHQESENGNVK